MGGFRFGYEEAFCRNIGWLTDWEQQRIRAARVAIAGLGGVGGAHLMTLVRLGIGSFNLADPDEFDLVNFNRQTGASVSTLGRPKTEALKELVLDVNPETRLRVWPAGVTADNVDDFLDGADLFVDGLDFFELNIRRMVFARCRARGIPAVTAAPLGMGAAYIVFTPDGMSFDQYFQMEGLLPERQQVNFLLGLSPRALHRSYLVDPSRVDLKRQRGPSTAMACQLCAGVVGAQALKLLLRRGPLYAAPYFHQFDPYRESWVRGRLRGGNSNPWQRLKLRFAYRQFERLARLPALEPTGVLNCDLEKILDLARWAPSGDNSQPWRFEIQSEDELVVHARDESDTDVYDYDGKPSLLSFGCLIESLRVAASGFGRSLEWRHIVGNPHEHTFRVHLRKGAAIEPDPLFPYLTTRSADRRRYQNKRLTEKEKHCLEETLGPEIEVRWFERWSARLAWARLNAQATRIRLSIPEAYSVHQRILDWDRTFSPTGVPSAAVGVDPITERVMRWVMKDWPRSHFVNRFLGGTILPRVQLDLIPGLSSGAHFMLLRKGTPVVGEDEAAVFLGAGQRMQRFWLEATRLGLVMQPCLAPLCFAYYGRHGHVFTEDAGSLVRAEVLARRFESLAPLDQTILVGRIGYPMSSGSLARSVRRPLAELVGRAPPSH